MLGICHIVAVFFNQTRPAIIAMITITILMYMQTYATLGASIGNSRVSLLSATVGLGLGLQTMVHEASFGMGLPINYDRYIRNLNPNSVDLNEISGKTFTSDKI